MSERVDWVIELLADHEREHFSCGVDSLDNFLKRLVTQYHQRNIGRTWVAVKAGSKEVLGYYTLSNGGIQPGLLPEKLRKKLPKEIPIPIVHLGRLAVDRSCACQGLGEHLLMDALNRSWLQSKQIGVYAIEVKAIDRKAESFYAKYGFSPLADDPLHMYLPIKTIGSLFEG